MKTPKLTFTDCYDGLRLEEVIIEGTEEKLKLIRDALNEILSGQKDQTVLYDDLYIEIVRISHG